jgi:hypothetical protein
MWEHLLELEGYLLSKHEVIEQSTRRRVLRRPAKNRECTEPDLGMEIGQKHG